MRKIGAIAGVCLAGLCGACGAQDGSADDLARGADENANTTRQSFAVRLDSATTPENVTAQIASAGREQIAALCAAEPGGAVRIYNLLASGAYEDIPCAAVLGDATGETSAALASETSGEPIGTVGQNWSPLTIVCGIFVGTAYLFASRVLCAHPRAERPAACRNVTDAGFLGFGIACGFM